ncbi:MAG: AzlC family ABC transporter permease [Clostridia bacterium]|nr:AzlC family ABC transporter permease [Clostridia bacterium]
MNKNINFKKGLFDGIPIGLGYLSVSIGIGISAINGGLSILSSLIMSMTNLTSAGQAAGIILIASGGSLVEMALIQLVVNLRYSLMGISLSQKLDGSFTSKHRLILGAFITDEIFAVSSIQEVINIKYMYGLIIVPYIGWAAGTLIGAAAGTVLPSSLSSALGLAIYGMFVAIVIPAVKKSKHIGAVVIISVFISTSIRYIPLFSFISYGFNIIISSVISASAVSIFSLRRLSK